MGRLQDITLEEFQKSFRGSGESVLTAAYAAQFVTDDDELAAAAKAAIDAEDTFAALLNKLQVEL